MLIDAGADMGAYEEFHHAALISAILNKHHECARMLIEAEAPMNTPGGEGITPLMASCHAGDEATRAFLIKRGCDLELRKTCGEPATLWAVRHGEEGCLRRLLAAGASPSAEDKYGVSSLRRAYFEGFSGGCAALLEAGANPEARGADGWSAVASACHAGHEECLCELARTGAAFDAAGREYASTRSGKQWLLPWFDGRAQAEREAALLEGATSCAARGKSGRGPRV